MKKLLSTLYETFSVRPGEGLRILLLLLHSLFVGLFVAFFTSTAFAMFLSRFEVSALPFVYIASAFMGYGAVTVFGRLNRRLSLPALLLSDLGFLLLLIAGFWAASVHSDNRWIAFLMLVWIVPSVTLIELEFWGLAVRLFDLRQGKRLFGLIGTGEVISSILGFFLVPFLVRALDRPVHLLVIAGAGLLLCMVVVAIVSRLYRSSLVVAATGARGKVQSSLTTLLKERYFVLISLLMLLFVVALYFVDFSFLSEVPLRFEGSGRVASFIGVFFGSTKVAELLTKIFLSGRLVSQFGLTFGLGILPFTLFLVAVAAVLVGTFGGTGATLFFILVALSKLMWVVLKQAIFDPSFKVLFQPLSSDQRLAVQTRVEGSVRQIGVLLAGLALLLFSRTGTSTVSLFVVLVPLLVAWVFVVVMLHREYRSRLMENLSAGMAGSSVAAPVEVLEQRLLQAPVRQLESAVAVLARVDATAVVPFLRSLVTDGDEEARMAGLAYLERLKAVGGSSEVERTATFDPSARVREVAARVLRTLREVQELADTPERISALAESPLPAQRDLAVSAIGFSRREHSRDRLAELLWDKDRDVRRAALVAAGRVGDPEHWHRIISQLGSPAFANAATFGLISIGEPILTELEKTFAKSEQEPEVRSRILRIYEHIGGQRAHELLLAKLRFPDRAVRRQALAALSHSGYRARGEAATVVENEISEVVGNTAWNMAALLDLGEDPAVTMVREAIEDEIADGRSALFQLLSLRHDPKAISLARANLESVRPEAIVYALEILDLVVNPEIKPLVLPVVEDLTPAQCVRRLDSFFYQERMSRVERLSAVINRDTTRISVWTKACALRAIGVVGSDGPAPDLPANLFHPDPLLREVAAGCLWDLGREVYHRQTRKLGFEAKDDLDRIILPARQTAAETTETGAEHNDWESRSIFGRTLALRRSSAFAEVPWGALVEIARKAEEHQLEAGGDLPAGRHPVGSLFLVLDGALEVDNGGADGPRAVGEGGILRFSTPANLIRATAATRVLLLDGEVMLQLVAENVELVDPVLGQQPMAEVGAVEEQRQAAMVPESI